MKRHVRFVLAALLFVIAAGACGGDGNDDGNGSNEEGGGVDLDEVMQTVPSRLSVEVDGHVSLSFEGDVDLLTTLINDPDATPLRFLSVGMTEMKQLDDGGFFRVAFDFPGAFDGAGEYELQAAGGSVTVPSLDPENPDPNAAAAGLSRAFVVFNEEGDPEKDPALFTSQQSFEVIVEPCSLEVDDDEGAKGTLTCPKLADTEGNTVQMEMRWEKR